MAMGFQEAKTDLVEMEFWNFDVLFQAQDHPAREIHDKFELADPAHGDLGNDAIVDRVRETHESGWELSSTGWEYEWSREKASRLMLRSQTTATTIRYLARGQPSPAKLFAIDRNFRYDEIDKTHFVEFYQAEGIVKAPDLSLRNLFGYLEVFAREIAGADDIRFRPGYFPFTEPSVELDAKHPELGWIELGGAGLFRPEVRKPLGVTDPGGLRKSRSDFRATEAALPPRWTRRARRGGRFCRRKHRNGVRSVLRIAVGDFGISEDRRSSEESARASLLRDPANLRFARQRSEERSESEPERERSSLRQPAAPPPVTASRRGLSDSPRGRPTRRKILM